MCHSKQTLTLTDSFYLRQKQPQVYKSSFFFFFIIIIQSLNNDHMDQNNHDILI